MASREEVNTERRLKLDGGLNSRDGYFTVRPDQCTSLQNFQFFASGSLAARDGAIVSSSLDPNIKLSSTGSYGDQNMVTLASVGGGTLNGTFNFKFVFRIRTGGQGASRNKVTLFRTFSIAGLVNNSVLISLLPNNLGEGVGQTAGIVDDPFMGGLVSTEVEIYVQKSTDPDFTFQSTSSFTWTPSAIAYQFTYTTYTTTGAVITLGQVGQTMVRLIKNWGEFNRVFVVMGDTLYSYNAKRFSVSTGPVPASYGTDKNGKLHYLSRLPTPMSMAFVSRVPIITDGFRAKKLNDQSVPSLDGAVQTRLLGANPSSASPTLGLVAGGVLNGTFQYKITMVYRSTRSTGFPTSVFNSGTETWDSESNSTVAVSASPVNQKVTVAFTGVLTAESALQFIRIYRTKAGGTTFFKLTDVVSPFATFTDNVADSALITTKTPPDDVGKDPCDLPPQNLLFLTEHQGLGWGAVGTQVVTTSDSVTDRVINFLGTNVVRLSKLMLISGQSDESTIDHWPNTVNYTVVCGGTSRITALLSHRGQLYVFKEDEIGVILGDQPGNFYYRVVVTGVGAVKQSVVVADGLIFFWDRSKGAFSFDGAGTQYVGTFIQATWETDDGNNFWCYGSFYDNHTNEVRWLMTDMPMDPSISQIVAGQGNAATVRGNWKEYVYFLTANAFTINQGTSFARNITAGAVVDVIVPDQNINSRRQLALCGNTEGRMFFDHTGPTDLGTLISASAEFAPFVGPNAETVKLWKKLMMSWSTQAIVPTQGNVILKAKFAEASTFTTLATLPFTTQAIGERMEVLDIPTNLSPPVSNDRGLLVRVETTLDAPLQIDGLFAQWRDITSVRKTVGH